MLQNKALFLRTPPALPSAMKTRRALRVGSVKLWRRESQTLAIKTRLRLDGNSEPIYSGILCSKPRPIGPDFEFHND
jgi:hypothetical protein